MKVEKFSSIINIRLIMSISSDKMLDATIFESVTEGICVIDLDFSIVRVNKALELLFGIKRKDILKKKCYDTFICDNCKTSNCPINKILIGSKIIETDTEISMKCGKSIYSSLRIFPFLGANGKIEGIIETFIDRGNRKLIEDELTLKSKIIEDVNVAISYADYNGIITYANNKFLELWGYENISDVIGKNISYFFKIEKNAEQVISHLRIFNEWNGEFDAKKKDGTVFISQAYASVIKDLNGKIVGFQSSNIDITEKYSKSKALKESETRFRELFNEIWSGVAIYTPLKNGSNFIIKDINVLGTKLSKIKKEDVVGKLITDVFPGVKDIGLFEVFQEVFKTEKPKHHPVSYYNDDNLSAWFENYVFKLPSGEIVAIYNDVTSRKKDENQLLTTKNNLEKLTNKLQKNFIDTVIALSSTVEYRDKYTTGHSNNVAELACAIAEEMGLLPEKIEALRMSGILHDIGKIAVPMAILSKLEPLSGKEYDLIKTHPKVGYDLIKHIEFTYPIARIVLEHHERIDGSGYPDGKKENELLRESKILAVADVVEAMSLPRPYRKALGVIAALDEIEQNSGITFDRDVVKACVKIFREKGFVLPCNILINK